LHYYVKININCKDIDIETGEIGPKIISFSKKPRLIKLLKDLSHFLFSLNKVSEKLQQELLDTIKKRLHQFKSVNIVVALSSLGVVKIIKMNLLEKNVLVWHP